MYTGNESGFGHWFTDDCHDYAYGVVCWGYLLGAPEEEALVLHDNYTIVTVANMISAAENDYATFTDAASD